MNAILSSFLGFMSIENPDGLPGRKRIGVTQVYMFCCGYRASFDNTCDTFPDGIILENYKDNNQHNKTIKQIKANIPFGRVSNPFVDIDRVSSLPRFIFNK